jgi:hypothetical protein
VLRALIVAALATTSALATAGCAVTTPAVDAAGPDAARCDGELELGRCLRVDGTECIGLIGEPAVFTPVADGGPIPIVVGHQGAHMLALAARGRGFSGGDPSEPPASRGNPQVELFIEDEAGEIVAVFRSRLPFAPDPADPALLVQPGVFVVVDDVPDAPLRARASLRDAAGVTRCGTLSFVPTR